MMRDRNGRVIVAGDTVLVWGRGRPRAGRVLRPGRTRVRVRVLMPRTGRDYELRELPEDLVISANPVILASDLETWGLAIVRGRRVFARGYAETLDEAARRVAEGIAR